MKIIIILKLILLLVIINPQALFSQESKDEKEKIQHHRIALFTGYTLVSGAVTSDSSTKMIVAPTIGFDYEYYFSEKIAIGSVNDLELDDYVVEDSEGELLERDYSFSTALIFIYEPFEWWSVFAGGGYEFESNEGFPLIKVGTDFTKKFEQGWDVGISIDYDIKAENSSPAIGVSIGKKLGKTY